ncbi:bifunctional nuclease 1 isoform X2 [Euphorbia lathyris]|uniref:bifunctional nuclease 1 isoform X2 n=1 Tax=Euphorbia lathyris TaxID=212925 RepID=UPI00331315BB
MMMLGVQFNFRSVSGIKVSRDERSYSNGLILNSNGGRLPVQFQFGLKSNLQFENHGGRKPILVSCKSSDGSSFDGGRSTNVPDDQDHEFLQASLLYSETAFHDRMRRRGLGEETRWRLPGRWDPSRAISRPSSDSSFVGHEFLRRFQSPTIFLKVSCDGEFLLPIIVGEFAIEKLLDAFRSKNEEGDCPDQFQLVRNLVEKLGYKVKMVRITERVIDTYFARVLLSKPGENEILSIDARPSDAINMANRCQAPIHVSKQIVFSDAIKISYGIGKGHDKKPTYDVSLDSAADGPDLLSEELDIVKNMNLAIKDERYNDAAMWRDKLMELRRMRMDIRGF